MRTKKIFPHQWCVNKFVAGFSPFELLVKNIHVQANIYCKQYNANNLEHCTILKFKRKIFN